jgi:RNA polymerase sigma-70 factor (ECF subfamily)
MKAVSMSTGSNLIERCSKEGAMVGIQLWWRAGAAVGHAARAGDAAEDNSSAEAVLLRAGQAGDRTALEQLLALHKGPLYALCRGMLGNADDADDAVQETFLHALRSLGGFRGDAAFRSWLFRIAINICLKWKASHPPTAVWEEGLAPNPSDAASPEALALRQLRLTEALSALLPRYRAVLLLKELEGWSVAEIAQAFGWNEKRAYNELYKARRALVEWRRRDAEEERR